MKITNKIPQEKIEKKVELKQTKAEEAVDLCWFKKNKPEEEKKTTIGDYFESALEDGSINKDEADKLFDELFGELPNFIIDPIKENGINGDMIISTLDKDGDQEVSEEELNNFLEENGLGTYDELKDKNAISLIIKIAINLLKQNNQ